MPQTCQRGSVLRQHPQSGYPLAQRQRRVQDRGRSAREAVGGDRPAVVVEDDREPGLDQATLLVGDPDIERRVIRLPDLVGRGRFAPVEQVELLPVGLAALVGQGDESRVEGAYDGVHRAVARRRPVVRAGYGRDLAPDRGDAGRRAVQGQPLDQLAQCLGEARFPRIPPAWPDQAGEASALVRRQAALERAQWHAEVRRQGGQRHPLLQVRTQLREARLGRRALRLGERRERRWGRHRQNAST